LYEFFNSSAVIQNIWIPLTLGMLLKPCILLGWYHYSSTFVSGHLQRSEINDRWSH